MCASYCLYVISYHTQFSNCYPCKHAMCMNLCFLPCYLLSVCSGSIMLFLQILYMNLLYAPTYVHSICTACLMLYIAVCCFINVSCLAIDCGDPGTPTNGQRTLSSTTYNSVVTYTCDVGYTLQGSNSRTCQSNGQWSGSIPHCSCE